MSKLSEELQMTRDTIKRLADEARGPKTGDFYSALSLREQKATNALLSEILFELRRPK